MGRNNNTHSLADIFPEVFRLFRQSALKVLFLVPFENQRRNGESNWGSGFDDRCNLGRKETTKGVRSFRREGRQKQDQYVRHARVFVPFAAAGR